MLKQISYAIMAMLFIQIAFAVTGQVTSFTGQSNPFNITFTGNQNQSFLLSIPQYSYSNNVNLTISGFESNTITNICYQETATVATDCGGLATGTYFKIIGTGINLSFINDTDYLTYTLTDTGGDYVDFEVNYSKPLNVKNAIWRVKDNAGEKNLTLPDSCFNAYTNKISLFIAFKTGGTGYTQWRCFNSTNYITLSDGGITGKVYEEGIYWNVSIFPNNITIYLNNIEQFNYSNLYNISSSIFLNTSLINSFLSTNQPINLTFHSDTVGILQVNLTNATYSYGIDNCSNSFNIPSNATALNISFYDINNALTNVNLTTTIGYDNTTYYTSHTQVNQDAYCIYPNWGTQTTNTQIRYVDSSGAVYYYNNPIVFDNSTYQLPLYVTIGATQTTFTIKDKNTNVVLQDTLCTSYIQLNGNYQSVESKLSDITGKIVFNYLENNNYKFLCSRAGYSDQLFYLLPPTETSYNIPMTPTTILNQSFDYDRISLKYSKGPFYNGVNNFTFIIGSLGELQSYGYTLTYPGGSVTNGGNNPNGEELTSQFTITGAVSSDLLYLDYWYSKVDVGNKTFYPTFAISVPTSNYTMIHNIGNTYGLGLIERVLICLFAAIFAVGMATLIGQPLIGFILGIILLGFFTFIGFFPIWAGIITFIFGAIFVFSRVEY